MRLKLTCPGSLEDRYFIEKDKKLIQAMRDKARKETDDLYREGHRYHCFRCGTKSLATIDFLGVEVDVCVNEECGCVHLDHGELEKLAKIETEESLLHYLQRCIFGLRREEL